MKISFKNIFTILKTASKEWWSKDPFRESAVIAYYSIFSLPGLLVVIITLAGYVFGRAAVNNHITAQVTATFGVDTSTQIQNENRIRLPGLHTLQFFQHAGHRVTAIGTN